MVNISLVYVLAAFLTNQNCLAWRRHQQSTLNCLDTIQNLRKIIDFPFYSLQKSVHIIFNSFKFRTTPKYHGDQFYSTFWHPDVITTNNIDFIKMKFLYFLYLSMLAGNHFSFKSNCGLEKVAQLIFITKYLKLFYSKMIWLFFYKLIDEKLEGSLNWAWEMV